MAEMSTEALVKGLRAWTKDHDPHVRAAVELLIWHKTWPRRLDFQSAAVRKLSGGEVVIDWDAARRFCDCRPGASTSELAVLDLAVALGEDRYRLAIMGTAHSRAIAAAVAAAVGLPADQSAAGQLAERRRIRHGIFPLAETLARPDGTTVEAIPVADLNEVIGSDA